jgi:hypothetical protein
MATSYARESLAWILPDSNQARNLIREERRVSFFKESRALLGWKKTN